MYDSLRQGSLSKELQYRFTLLFILLEGPFWRARERKELIIESPLSPDLQNKDFCRMAVESQLYEICMMVSVYCEFGIL